VEGEQGQEIYRSVPASRFSFQPHPHVLFEQNPLAGRHAQTQCIFSWRVVACLPDAQHAFLDRFAASNCAPASLGIATGCDFKCVDAESGAPHIHQRSVHGRVGDRLGDPCDDPSFTPG